MKARKALTTAQRIFLAALDARHLPRPLLEFKFDLDRKWRADYCWPGLILEVDGGVWTHGRHTRGGGWEADTEKMWGAAALGYRWVRCQPKQLASPVTLDRLTQLLTER